MDFDGICFQKLNNRQTSCHILIDIKLKIALIILKLMHN